MLRPHHLPSHVSVCVYHVCLSIWKQLATTLCHSMRPVRQWLCVPVIHWTCNLPVVWLWTDGYSCIHASMHSHMVVCMFGCFCSKIFSHSSTFGGISVTISCVISSMHCCVALSVSQSTTLAEISLQLFDGLPWNLAQTFMVPWGWIVLVIPRLCLAPPWGWHF